MSPALHLTSKGKRKSIHLWRKDRFSELHPFASRLASKETFREMRSPVVVYTFSLAGMIN